MDIHILLLDMSSSFKSLNNKKKGHKKNDNCVRKIDITEIRNVNTT